MRNFKKYEVWKLAHEITLMVYELTSSFPKSELYGITSQLRRASSSVAANIAEGCGRESQADFRRFLIIANGSAKEVDYFLLLSCDLNLITTDVYKKLAKKVELLHKKLNKLIVILNG